LLFEPSSPKDRIQGRLLNLAALFLFLFSLALTFSPAVRWRSWEVDYRWDHWIGYAVWLSVFIVAHVQTTRRLPDRDPYLLPIGALLSGWGLLTIWRLFPAFGYRQTAWLLIVGIVLILVLKLTSDLSVLKRYKYLWLTGGLILTALTLLIGANPAGDGFPRLWLGFFGLYFQPSEPLKLLLIIYLAAYLAGGNKTGAAPVMQISKSLLPLLAPTLIMTSLALLLLVFQRDLGTATIFLFIYATVIYVASGRKVILFLAAVLVFLAGVMGYSLFDVVRIRVDAWINPWLDPLGGSYQIIQSLISIANGGLIGRGPGLGSPSLVPVPHSDFIFSAIAEETGLAGTIALLSAIGLLAGRGIITALQAPDNYRRFLAAGITTHLVAQSILIIGGNLRLLPLTVVTLPFVSYGGSSLLTSFLSLVILLHISSRGEEETAPLRDQRPYLHIGMFLAAGLIAAALVSGWWAVFRSPDLLVRADNPRRAISDRFVPRGALLDRNEAPLSVTQGNLGSYSRASHYPPLGLVTGYTHPVYGQTGLEASLDRYLRGLQGAPDTLLWWNQLLYGQPSPGLNIRTTLDLDLQTEADRLLEGRTGAATLLNARTGNIWVMASHPNFDPNHLQETWPELLGDERAPLLNRVTQGLYQPGPALGPLLLAGAIEAGLQDSYLPPVPGSLSYPFEGGQSLTTCAFDPISPTWGAVIQAGCPRPVIILGQALYNSPDLRDRFGGLPLTGILEIFGLYSSPAVRLPVAGSALPPEPIDLTQVPLTQTDLLVSPLQMALAAAALTSDGMIPAPRLVLAYQSPDDGWVSLAASSVPRSAITASAAQTTVETLAVSGTPLWQALAVTPGGAGDDITWFLGGTLPGYGGVPLSIVILLEENNPPLAEEIGQSLLHKAIQQNITPGN
jgi:cell division protein FtsW (lipid II flippase)